MSWRFWATRYGSPRAAATTVGLLLLTLAITLVLHQVAGKILEPAGELGKAIVANLPWTVVLLWLLYAGVPYALMLCGAFGVLLPNSACGQPYFSAPLGLLAFALVARALPFDPALRSWMAYGVFFFAAFCAAAVSSIVALSAGARGGWMAWQSNWMLQLLQDALLTGGIALAAGNWIERVKRQRLGAIPVRRLAPQLTIFAFPAMLAILIGFCLTWAITAERPLSLAIEQLEASTTRQMLETAHREAALRNGALVALLLGAVCGGASLMLLMMQRYREQLRAEITRGTEALRRRHLQLGALQQATEATGHSLDPHSVCQAMATTLARLTDAAQVAVYMPSAQNRAQLELVHQQNVRPASFQHGVTLPVQGSLSGKCLESGAIVSVKTGLPDLIQPPELRPSFKEHHLESMLCIPILGEGSTVGVASLSFDTPYAPDEEEERLFRLIGRAIGTALERAATHDRARRYAADLAGLYRFSQQLAVESEEPRLLDAAASGAMSLLNAEVVAFFLASGDSDATSYRCSALHGSRENQESLRQFVVHLHEPGLLGEALRERRTQVAGTRAAGPDRHVLAKGWTESSAIIVPLPPPGADLPLPGVMIIAFGAAKQIGLEESGLAEEIARQAAAGLRRARLIEKTRQQAAELRLLEQIGRTLSQRLSTAVALEQLVQNVNKVVAVKWASVFAFDPDSQSLRVRATTFTQPGANEINIPMTARSIVVSCLREGRTLHAPDMFNDPRTNKELNIKFQTASGVCVPLGPAGQRFGVLMVNNPTPGSFSADEIRRLEALAQLASAAIERARIYEESMQRADELILLNEVGHLLVENPALEQTLQRIAELVNRAFQASGTAFLLLNRRKDALVGRGVSGLHSRKLRFARIPLTVDDVTTRAYKLNQVQTVENSTDERLHPMVLKRLPTFSSGVAVPMSGAHGPAGVLVLWKDQPCRFKGRELQSLSAVARLAAAAVYREELGQALSASEERLQDIVDGLHVMIFSIDTRGMLLSFNAACERVSGRKRAEVLGQGMARVASEKPEERARINAFIQAAFQTGDSSSELTVNWGAPDGSERKIKIRGSFLRGADGKVNGMVCLGMDVTEQALLEAQLMQAQKMESVGALAGGMAHDFNNLLGGILGQCSLAKAQNVSDPVLSGCVAKIEAAAQRGADLTSKLMAFARKSVLQPRAVDIAALIQECAELLSGSLPRSISIQTKIEPNLPPVHGDPTQLQQVLLNLCVNARDAMPGGGTLTIAAEPISTMASGTESVLMPTGVQIEVADTGIGMSEYVLQHIFEPFFTTKEPGKGTGLGLSLVFGIVRSHGGQINVESKPGGGTKFTIRLPSLRPRKSRTTTISPGSSAEQSAVPESSAMMKAVALGGSEPILLIDDDAMLRETTRALLERLGYKIRACSNGVDALKALDGGFVPALVLLDVVMPGLAGVPLLKEIRQRAPQAPVVLVSGYSTDQMVQAMLENGAFELVQKPFTMEALATAIRRALDSVKVKSAGLGSGL